MGQSRQRGGRGRAAGTGRVVAVMTLAALLVQAPSATAATPPRAPELVAPIEGRVFGPSDPQMFTVRVVDDDHDGWVAIIEVTNLDTARVTTFVAGPGRSGEFAGTVAVPPLTLGRYEWRAHAIDTTGLPGPWSTSVGFRVGVNRPPGTPSLLAPADGAELRRDGNEPFSITAIDPDLHPYTGTIVVRRAADGSEVTRFSTSPAASGTPSFGVLTASLSEGAYTWTAEARDIHGAPSGPSATRSFTVGPQLTAGGGAALGTAAYDLPGVPLGLCESTRATYALDSAVAVFNAAIVGYVGPVAITGTTTSTCESASFATGAITLDIVDTATTASEIHCPGLTGSFTRIGAALAIEAVGGCVVNGFPISRVRLTAALAFTPTEASTRVVRATVGGTFVVRPE